MYILLLRINIYLFFFLDKTAVRWYLDYNKQWRTFNQIFSLHIAFKNSFVENDWFIVFSIVHNSFLFVRRLTIIDYII